MIVNFKENCNKPSSCTLQNAPLGVWMKRVDSCERNRFRMKVSINRYLSLGKRNGDWVIDACDSYKDAWLWLYEPVDHAIEICWDPVGGCKCK